MTGKTAKKRFVSRADDLGSSRAANAAIAAVLKAGFIKNASVMACAPFAGEAAALLKGSGACFGMHMTLNAEWDNVKWKPVSKLPKASGLTDENGFFLPDPALFAQTKPPIELVMQEVEAQYARLLELGFDIKYIDSHMFAEAFIPNLDDAVRRFALERGLIDHMYFYAMPPRFDEVSEGKLNIVSWLASIPEGQYFIVAHPAFYGEEMLKTGNAGVSGETVAKGRHKEAKLYSGKAACLALKALGCGGLRYDEAAPLTRRLTVADILRSLNAKQG